MLQRAGIAAAQTDVLKAQRPKNGQSAHIHALCALVTQAEL
jgi:hypothetical protein